MLSQDNSFRQSQAAAQFNTIYMKINSPGKRIYCYCAFIIQWCFVLLQVSSDAQCQSLFELSVSNFGKEKEERCEYMHNTYLNFVTTLRTSAMFGALIIIKYTYPALKSSLFCWQLLLMWWHRRQYLSKKVLCYFFILTKAVLVIFNIRQYMVKLLK